MLPGHYVKGTAWITRAGKHGTSLGGQRGFAMPRFTLAAVGCLITLALALSACSTSGSDERSMQGTLASASVEAGTAASTLADHATLLRTSDGDSLMPLAAELNAMAIRLDAMSFDVSTVMLAVGEHFSRSQAAAALKLGQVEGDVASLRDVARRCDRYALAIEQYAARVAELALSEHTGGVHLRALAIGLTASGARLEILADEMERAAAGQRLVLGLN